MSQSRDTACYLRKFRRVLEKAGSCTDSVGKHLREAIRPLNYCQNRAGDIDQLTARGALLITGTISVRPATNVRSAGDARWTLVVRATSSPKRCGCFRSTRPLEAKVYELYAVSRLVCLPDDRSGETDNL